MPPKEEIIAPAMIGPNAAMLRESAERSTERGPCSLCASAIALRPAADILWPFLLPRLLRRPLAESAAIVLPKAFTAALIAFNWRSELAFAFVSMSGGPSEPPGQPVHARCTRQEGSEIEVQAQQDGAVAQRGAGDAAEITNSGVGVRLGKLRMIRQIEKIRREGKPYGFSDRNFKILLY